MSTPKKQVLIATYHVFSYFKVPDGINLEDKEQVSQYNIKWNTLQIELKNGEIMEIESTKNEHEPDLKYCDGERIDDYNKYQYYIEGDEESDESDESDESSESDE